MVAGPICNAQWSAFELLSGPLVWNCVADCTQPPSAAQDLGLHIRAADRAGPCAARHRGCSLQQEPVSDPTSSAPITFMTASALPGRSFVGLLCSETAGKCVLRSIRQDLTLLGLNTYTCWIESLVGCWCPWVAGLGHFAVLSVGLPWPNAVILSGAVQASSYCYVICIDHPC